RCVLLDDGTARCWGANDKGQLGDGDSGQGKQQTAPASVPVDFGVGRSATSLSVGASHSCAVLDNQQVVCWGDNTKGQLGSGDTVSRSQISGEFIVFRQAICGGVCVDTDTSRHCGQCSVACSSSEICSVGRCVPRVTAIAAQEQRTCSSQNGLLKCWGRNDKGQLGYGDTAPREAPSVAPIDLGVGRTARSVAPGEDHLCALLDNGTVKCWGYNGAGQLGYGDSTQRTAPSVDSIDLGVGRFAKSISAGGSFTCALLDNNTLKCWGANNYGQLGYGDGAPRYAPPLAPIDLGTGRTASFLATANTHACAILDNGALKCWGRNDYGQLGYGDTTQRNAPPAVAVDLGAGRTAKRVALGGWFACAILDDGTVKCWGANHDGQLGYGDTTNRTAPSAAAVELGLGRTAKELSLGLSHACALLDDATVKCWGDLTYQIPGVSLVLVSSPPFAPLDIGSGRTATSIASGNLHTCALLDDGSVKCWGANTKGQLGYGDFVDRSVSDVFPLPFR
ncbi:hypothetical protein L6R29_05255, partial [Myxococcota bacterium]|nr:hypothetical protein [Myxococcota bacterium]